jgi:5,6,7,8-tetrahydromethanopterin hydro-lyase
VAEGTVPEAEVEALLLIAAVWVNPQASDERAVFEHNRAATLGSLRNGALGRPAVADALAARHAPANAFWRA